MKLLDRIFASPELQQAPPVLVDVGAAGGVAPIWRSIAKYSIGVGFEPDARDAARLQTAHRSFKRWVYGTGLVAPDVDSSGQKEFYLTRQPHCSSLLKPRHDRLQDWCFADYFRVQGVTSIPAVRLHDVVAAHGLERIDWLKCDTQGLDFSIFASLPASWRSAMLAVDFEPGLIDAYEGEDKTTRTLQAMETEPFWLCELQVGKYPRGNPAALRAELGDWTDKWLPRLAPAAPVYVNLRYLHQLEGGTPLERRDLLLLWVFADLVGQHTHALLVARNGAERFGGTLFDAMRRHSRHRLRWSMLRKVPRWLGRRLGFPA